MKNKWTFYFAMSWTVIGIVLIVFYVLNFYVFDMSVMNKVISSLLIAVIVIVVETMLFVSYYLVIRKKEQIKNSFDYYIENQISASGTGVLIFNNSFDIIWVSKFIEKRFQNNLIGKKVELINNQFAQKYKKGITQFRFDNRGFIFEATIKLSKKIIILKDVTNEEQILKQYTLEKLVIGEIEIDNFSQFQVTFSEEELFKAQVTVIQTLDNLSEKYNFIYRQYVNGKYIFFTNEGTLKNLVKNNFNFLDVIRKHEMDSSVLTISIGIGAGTSVQKDLQKLARDGLKNAQSRGGDQVALMLKNEKPKYFGSEFEMSQAISRVKIKQIARLLELRLLDDEIENVIIYGHRMADLDALGSSLGIKELAETYNKKVYICNITFDSTTNKVLREEFSKNLPSFFIKKQKANQISNLKTLIVIVDTSNISRIENIHALDKVDKNNVFIFDHHRIFQIPKKIPSSNVYVDTSSSSACEIIIEILSFIKKKVNISKKVAQMILNGIFLDTNNFTKSVSSRTYQAASFLESKGALSSISSNLMRIPNDASILIFEILKNIQEIKPGYFLTYYDGKVPDDVISMAAHEILRIQGRQASFVIAKSSTKKNFYKMSARSIEKNVQRISEAIGGGGHFGVAAATSKEPLEVFIDNIRQAIISDKGDE